jgi:hypothetical protein
MQFAPDCFCHWAIGFQPRWTWRPKGQAAEYRTITVLRARRSERTCPVLTGEASFWHRKHSREHIDAILWGVRLMRAFSTYALLALSAVVFATPGDARSPLSDGQIKQRIIKQSIASYPGACACPYNTARNGSSCGGRSAWSRGGGYAPMCYAKDVSKAQVNAWRAGH